jgi:hypothetical protein
MCGHDYAPEFGELKAHFGVMLLSRTQEQLYLAWQAMKTARREMATLDRRVEF